MSLLVPRLIAEGWRLERRERRVSARALGWLVVATAAARMLSYATLVRTAGRIPAGRSARTAISPVECATAIRRAARVWPAACLPQAVAGYCLLRRAGIDATITLGVAMDDRHLDAHAWLECNGMVVTGGYADRVYTPLTTAGRQAR